MPGSAMHRLDSTRGLQRRARHGGWRIYGCTSTLEQDGYTVHHDLRSGAKREKLNRYRNFSAFKHSGHANCQPIVTFTYVQWYQS